MRLATKPPRHEVTEISSFLVPLRLGVFVVKTCLSLAARGVRCAAKNASDEQAGSEVG